MSDQYVSDKDVTILANEEKLNIARLNAFVKRLLAQLDMSVMVRVGTPNSESVMPMIQKLEYGRLLDKRLVLPFLTYNRVKLAEIKRQNATMMIIPSR